LKKSFIIIIVIVSLLLFGNISISPAQDADIKRAEQLRQQLIQLYKQKKFSDAVPIAREVLAIQEKILGKNHPRTVVTLNNLALLYKAMGDYSRAEPLYQRALAICEKTLGPNHHDTATTLNNLAVLYQAMGDYSRAEPLYQRALAICEKTLGPNHHDTAATLNNLALVYQAMGDYSRAKPLYQRALVICEKTLGPNHHDTAAALNNLAKLYKAMGDYSSAEPLYQRALAIFEKTLGPDNPNTATSLNNLAMLYKAMGDYSKAEPLYQRALAIFEKTLGLDNPNTAAALNNLAELYQAMGDYSSAEPLYQKALTIREKALGNGHPDTAQSLNNLAELYRVMGDYSSAEPFYQKALANFKKALGPKHSDTAGTLNNLAMLYKAMGDYSSAEPLYQKALAIQENALGPDHPLTATSLNNLAVLYQAMGDYSSAEPLFKRALAIREKALGPDHPSTASSLNNLALLYEAMGDYPSAEPLSQRALAIQEKALGPDHPSTTTSLNNLATLYYSMGDYIRAEPLLQRALAISEKTLGKDHPDTATKIHNLAGLYQAMGDYPSAEPLSQRALAIREKALGKDHPDTAQSLNNLAELYRAMGDYSKAKPLFQRSLAIREKALGPDHPDTANTLNNLAVLMATNGNYASAYKLFIRAQEISTKLIDQVMGFTSENQKMKFLATQRGTLEAAMSLVALHMDDDEKAVRDIMDVWLRRKGVILEAQRRYQEALVYSKDPKTMAIFQELARVRSRLSQMNFAGPGKEGPAEYRRKIAELETTKKELEARLSNLSKTYALNKKIELADSAKVARALPEKTVLIEFARIHTYNFEAKGKEKHWLPPRYISFSVHSGKGKNIKMIDLGNAEKIDMAVAQFKKDMNDSIDKESISFKKASRNLHDLVFEPLKKALGEVKEIYISPDGNLNLIPFEVLQGPDGRFLIEDYTFNYLAAGRDVLRFGEITEKGDKALIIGDPDFDMGTGEKKSVLKRLALIEGKEKHIVKRSSDMRGLYFSRLPGTRKEVEEIQNIIGRNKSEIYTGKMALEEILMNKGAPRILHLATHGFFLNDLDLSALRDDSPGRGINEVSMIPKSAPLKKVKIENPLLRSGIALAGANNTLGSSDMEKNDGIVTAEKILGLRLRGTDMVVLSACDTGVGEVKAGEGVFGLRRAFTQTGAKSLVMSMWSVPDRETKELMVEFYRNIQSGGMNRCQALRQAALKQMEIVKERYGNANPFYWGAFVFAGEP